MNVLQMSITAGVLIFVITVIRALAINRLPKKTFLVLWGIVLLRLFVPFLWPSSLSFYSVINYSISKQASDMPLRNIIQINPTINATTSFPLWKWLWCIGVLLCALYFIVAYFRCRSQFVNSKLIENDFVTHWLAAHRCNRSLTIRQSNSVSAPLTYGVLHPVILMPMQTDWSDTQNLQYILTHEYIHIRRFDGVAKFVLIAALCIHWFNPLVWAMFVLANRDIELSCDETVMQTFGLTIRSSYALALVGMEETKSAFTPMCNNFSKNATEERVKAIMKLKPPSHLVFFIATLIVVGVTIVFATSATQQTARATFNGQYPSEMFNHQYIEELEQGQHTSDLDPLDVLATFISDYYPDANVSVSDFQLLPGKGDIQAYASDALQTQITINKYQIRTLSGDSVYAWYVSDVVGYFRF